ncbi:MAG: Mur ligase domain-containing protein [Oscillospiraceae bacterium]
MKLSELLQGVEVLASTAPAAWEITGVAYDSRQVQPGNAFVAISGFATDGNRYISKAMDRGACLVVTEQVPQSRCRMCRWPLPAGPWQAWAPIGTATRPRA